jgi:hypothetical protein
VVVPIIISTENESENIIKVIAEIKDIFMQNMFKGKSFESKVITILIL